MLLLVYEDDLQGFSGCIYKTEAKNLRAYAREAYKGRRTKDIVLDLDDVEDHRYLKVDFVNGIITNDLEDDEPVVARFDKAIRML